MGAADGFKGQLSVAERDYLDAGTPLLNIGQTTMCMIINVREVGKSNPAGDHNNVSEIEQSQI